MASNNKISALEAVNAMSKAVTAMMFTQFIGSMSSVGMFVLMPTHVPTAIAKWNEACKYIHTYDDLQKIADGKDNEFVHVYYGAPEEYAESLVLNGFKSYRIEYLAKEVASKYEIPWKVFMKYSVRSSLSASDEMQLSSAPVLVAFRWASNFSHGEVLSEMNSTARILKMAMTMPGRLSNNYDKIHKDARKIAEEKGLQYSDNTIPELLGLPDKYPRTKSTGAIVQIKVRASKLEHAAHDAKWMLEERNDTERAGMTLLSWNDNYRDMRLNSEDIISMKIVVRGIPYGASDVIQGIEDKSRFDINTGMIRN